MKPLIFSVLFLFMGPLSIFAQTATPTVDCCQVAMVLTPVPTYSISAGAATGPGTLYACDPYHDHILKFSLATGYQVGTIALPGGMNPAALFFAENGYLYVGGYGGQVILKVAPENGASTTIVSGMGLVRGVALDPANEDIYAAMQSGTIKIFKKSNGYLDDATSIALPVDAVPTGIWVSGNTVYVSWGDIWKFTHDGDYNFAPAVLVATNPTVVNVFHLAMDTAGHLYAASFGDASYSILDVNNGNTVLKRCNVPDNCQGIAVDNYTGNVYLTGTDKIYKMPHCPGIVVPTPTPFYQGANPPESGQCFIYPSPARGDHATLSCLMAEGGRIELKIWNENGELAAQIESLKPAGIQVVPFSLTKMASGIYYYVVTLQYDSGRLEKLKTRKFAVIH